MNNSNEIKMACNKWKDFCLSAGKLNLHISSLLPSILYKCKVKKSTTTGKGMKADELHGCHFEN